MIKILGIPHKTFKFSGGELQVKLDPNKWELLEFTEIYAHIVNADEVMELLLSTDALRRYNSRIKIGLKLPYLPYARQDRVCDTGEALSLKVFTNLINSQEYEYVQVSDVHSTVSLALLNNVEDYSVKKIFINARTHIGFNKNTILVSPDSGSLKKVGELAKEFGLEMVRADKLRNVQTGEITETKVYSNHVGDKNFLIVDDICDGGKTFTELAKVLRPLTSGKIELYVTHGIFSKGLEVFRNNFDRIYTAYVFPDVVVDPNILTVLKGI